MSSSLIITAEEIILLYKKEPRKMSTDQQHKQTLSLRPESKLFPKFILETSLPGSQENFRITLPAKPGLYEIINLNLSKSCPVKLDQLNPDPNGEPWIAGGLPEITPEIQAKIDAIPEMVLSTISSSIELPVVVDNSLNIFMRPIFLQSDNSCAQASGVGYDFTYEINRVRNIPSNVDVNQYPTHYTWNFLNGGGDNGSWYYYGWDIIKENGCPNVPTWGGMAGDLKRWMTGYDNYYSGMFNKVDSYWSINLGTPDGLETFKHWINDHNVGADIGGLGCFSIYMSGVEYGTLPPASAEAGKHIIADFHYDTGGSHAMTFVGYNDEILYDINGDGLFTNNLDTNEDGLIDMLDWEIGALKIANSWNTGWPFPIDGGYSYIPYRLLPKKVYNPVNPLQSMYVITGKKTYVLVAKEEYSPELTIKGEVDYLCRGKLGFKVGYANYANEPEPVEQTYLSSFNFQGGCWPMQGINYNPIEFGLDFSHFYGNDDFGKIFFIVRENTDQTNEFNGNINRFSMIDHRWGEDFELECTLTDGPNSVTLLNSTYTQLSIEYDLIPHEQPITTPLTFNSNMVSRFSPTVTHSTLSVGTDKAVKVDMYQSELIIEEGSNLIVGNNCNFYAKRGPSKISINGNITIGTGVSFASGDFNSTLELNFNNPGQTVYISDCHFSKCNIKSVSPLVFNNCVFNYTTISSHADFVATNSVFNYSSVNETMDDIEITGSAFDHSSILASNPSIGSIPINNTAIITSNGFTTANSDAGSVIEVYGYRNYNISENTINTVDSPASTSHGIAIHYSGTTDARNMHTISNNTIFCEESNCTHSISGITLYSSVADITGRNNIHHNFIGIQSLGNSQVKLPGDPTATNVSNAQRIINNRRVQLYASQNAFPTQTDHNVIFSANTNDCYVRHDVSALINPPKVDVVNNYWGTSFNQEVNLCPAGHYNYSPIWDLTPIQAERSSVQQLYATADSLVADSNYTAAKATYQQVVTTYPEKEQAVSSMKAVLYLEPLAGNNFDGLKEWYLNEPAILNNELLLKLSDNLANKCNEKLESYPEAIAWYENVIQNPETLEDSIFAIIDLEHLYWQMGIDTSLRSASYTGSMPQFKPKSFQSFRDQKDELLRLLYGTKTNVAENEPITPEDKLFNGSLSQNIPNPCSGKTQIYYTLEAESAVQLNIYNYTGQLIKSVNVGIRPEGTHTLVFDAGCLHNGVYFYTLNINGRNSASKKMMVLK